MLFNYRYSGSTSVASTASSVGMSFAPDTLRDPTYFVGKLGKHIPFREAISALHDVVISDLRYKPKDKSEYKEWAAQQEDIWLSEMMKGAVDVEAKVRTVREELTTLRAEKAKIMDPFYKARKTYFDFLYEKDREAWFVLDPVITVHPDEVFFECFSQDEASYGKLGCNYNVFSKISSFKCGTTNIDYSSDLYNEFQKIRDYKETSLTVDPEGFNVETTGEENYREVKIDLPDSWVRGFLQVSSAMTLPAVTFTLEPMDVHNICFMLRRFKEKHGPRSMRYILRPGEPIRIVFEPWNFEIKCARSIYKGNEATEVRCWGRRRMLILERLIPIAKKVTVTLLGSGMPSFYVADLGDMNFTLGLSGWTANDWSRLGNFDLMAPRAEVDSFTMQKVYMGLRENWVEDANSLSKKLDLDRNVVLGALSAFTQAGRVIYDLDKQMYRVRELSRDPLPMEVLRFANEREAMAHRIVDANRVKRNADMTQDGLVLTGEVTDTNFRVNQCSAVIDRDERLAKASCSCNFFKQNKLFKGPCEHILALRIMHQRISSN
jgi:hypothetical protein